MSRRWTTEDELYIFKENIEVKRNELEPIMHIYIINVSQTIILINSHIHTCIAIYNFSYICMLPSAPVTL